MPTYPAKTSSRPTPAPTRHASVKRPKIFPPRVERPLLVDELDAIKDYVRTIDLAVLGLSTNGGTGPRDWRALRTMLDELASRLEAMRVEDD